MQTGAWPLSTFSLHGSTTSVEGNRFLSQGFQPCGGADSTPAQSPPLPQTQHWLAPQKATSHNRVQNFPISLSVHQPVTQTDLYHLWRVHLWVSESPSSRSSSLLQDLRCAVLSLHVAVQETKCSVTLSQCETLSLGVGSHPLRGPSPCWAMHLLVP